MRLVLGLCALMALAGCGTDDKAGNADAAAADFVPPSVMSRLDFGSAQERRFQRLDRNADGKITNDELPRGDNSRLLALDRDGNGEIGSVEFSEGALARFDAMDLNKDGTVTSEERETSRGGR
ncbi:hypothetical protein ASE75_10255 [Sphingomonas sp. Leaf17]|uniref:hypothetical protein n=1 Tax=Sphingomonas sp. Leaf17 TaxID=1735683 RepID=UPI0006F1CB51|nr:hypothetical protein [Sphingomonas sp. Leaf17]KQM64349.1 hypothetical protein ASE75_10255 [Sphingomonas sp. Leaf17]